MGPGFSFDQDVLPAVGDAALGAHNAAQWSPDLDNAANKAFVEAFEAEYDRLPSVYASQAYDTALLILSAQRHGRHRRPRRLPRGAQGRRLPHGPRQLQVRQQPAPDPELLRPRGGEARRRRHHQQDRRHRLREPRRRLRRRVPDAVTLQGGPRRPASPPAPALPGPPEARQCRLPRTCPRPSRRPRTPSRRAGPRQGLVAGEPRVLCHLHEGQSRPTRVGGWGVGRAAGPPIGSARGVGHVDGCSAPAASPPAGNGILLKIESPQDHPVTRYFTRDNPRFPRLGAAA